MADIIIKNIDILTGEAREGQSTILRNAVIAVKDGYIARIFTEDTMNLPENQRYIDDLENSGVPCLNGHGHLAAPGLINTHTHLAMGLFRNYADDLELMDWLQNAIWPAEAKLNQELVRTGSTLGIAEMLRSGTTCFNDMYFFMEDTAEIVKNTGIRAVLSRGMAGVAPTAEQALVEAKELFNKWHGFDNDRIKVMLGPHAPYTCPDAYLEKVMSLSHELGAQIHVHLCETKIEIANYKKQTGQTPIAHFNDLGVFDNGCVAAHCVHVTDEDIEIMATKKVRVAHNPQSNLKLASGIAPLPKLLANGITVGLGTDGSASNNNADMLEEVRLAAMLHKGTTFDPKAIPAQTALELGTVKGAQVLDYTDLGLLKEGYRADIVLYDVTGLHWLPRYNDAASLVYAASSADVRSVIVAGKLLLKEGELLTIDEEKLRAEVAKAQAIFA